MEAKAANNKTYHLTHNDQWLGELAYANLFYLKAEIRLVNTEVYEIKPKGFLGTSIKVWKQGIEIADIHMTWRGHVAFAFNNGREYALKTTGMLNNKYSIENEFGETLLQLEPEFKWNKFNYNYKVPFTKNPHDILLVMLGIYGANYFVNAMSGSML